MFLLGQLMELIVGTVFYRNGKFSITTHCGILRVKPQYRDKVDFEYLNFILNQTLPNYKLGEGSNKRLGTERMKEVQIEIPIDENGDFDVTKQREIAGKHKKIEEIKAKLKDNYEKMINSKVIKLNADIKFNEGIEQEFEGDFPKIKDYFDFCQTLLFKDYRRTIKC